MHHHPSTVLARLADALHRAYARLFGDRVTHDAAARHHRSPGRPAMVLAGTIVRAQRAHRALRAETSRMADLLDGARRGHRDAQHVTMRAALKRMAPAVPRSARLSGHRFITTARATRTALRTGAREAVAVAADTARRMGARHRHVPGTTDVQHDFVARLVAYGKKYERTRARGERSIWKQGSGRLAW